MFSIIKLRLLRLKDDYAAYVLLTLMAFGLTVVFGLSFDGYRPTILVVDEDRSNYSEAFINELWTNKEFNFSNSDIENAAVAVEENKVLAALIIHKGFEAGIKGGEEVSLGIIKVKDDTLILTLKKTVSGIASGMTEAAKRADIVSDFIHEGDTSLSKQEIRDFSYKSVMEAQRYKKTVGVTSYVDKMETYKGYDGLKHSMIGFSLFFSMYTVVFAIGTILSDRQYKTWQRMLVSPVSKASILGGSMIVAYITGAVQLGILIIAGKYLLKMDWGSSMAGVLMVAGSFVFTVTSMGLLLSGIVKTYGQLSSITPVILTSTSMIGGCMWPLEIVNSRILLFLAQLTPQKWAIQGMENIASGGMGFEAAIIPTAVLLVMGAVFFTAGVRLVKYE